MLKKKLNPSQSWYIVLFWYIVDEVHAIHIGSELRNEMTSSKYELRRVNKFEVLAGLIHLRNKTKMKIMNLATHPHSNRQASCNWYWPQVSMSTGSENDHCTVKGK